MYLVEILHKSAGAEEKNPERLVYLLQISPGTSKYHLSFKTTQFDFRLPVLHQDHRNIVAEITTRSTPPTVHFHHGHRRRKRSNLPKNEDLPRHRTPRSLSRRRCNCRSIWTSLLPLDPLQPTNPPHSPRPPLAHIPQSRPPRPILRRPRHPLHLASRSLSGSDSRRPQNPLLSHTNRTCSLDALRPPFQAASNLAGAPASRLAGTDGEPSPQPHPAHSGERCDPEPGTHAAVVERDRRANLCLADAACARNPRLVHQQLHKPTGNPTTTIVGTYQEASVRLSLGNCVSRRAGAVSVVAPAGPSPAVYRSVATRPGDDRLDGSE